MNNPEEYYKQNFNKYQLKTEVLRRKMSAFSFYRLVVFLCTLFGVYITFSNWQFAFLVGFSGVVAFVFFLYRYNDIKRLRDFNKVLATINYDEIEIESGNFHERYAGLNFQDQNHFYSLDIDLFGRGSFFQFINRTSIKEGTALLANNLLSNNTEDIVLRQEAIRELKSKIEWQQHYSATSRLIEVDTPAKLIISWLKEYKPFLPKIMQRVSLTFIVLSLTITGLAFFNIIDGVFLLYLLLLGLIITGKFLRKINNLASNTAKVKDTFRQYTLLLNLIEHETFTSELLVKQQMRIQSQEKKASDVFKEFSRLLDALDNRNNIIGAIFGNGFFLTDIKNSYKIEQWIARHSEKVSDWFKAVAFFDAFNSLGTFSFNHPDFIFPKIVSNTNFIIKAEDLGHPMLKKAKRVDSDVTINNEEFFIVTGANMAGKSTFLRAVSLHIVMSNIGLPVCAKTSLYSPIKLITSMRTSDSLTDDSSYFFSELTRLKFITDTIRNQAYFVILDEILKGTNSTDKAIGSRKFVEKLVASNATGIIATHDLSLCEIEKKLQVVKNYYFDAEITNDELYFDYKFKKGVCLNMNASFLLKKMEII